MPRLQPGSPHRAVAIQASSCLHEVARVAGLMPSVAVAAALLAGCAVDSPLDLGGEPLAFSAAEGCDPGLPRRLRQWTLEDRAAVASSLRRPVPSRRLRVHCGEVAGRGGEARLAAGENGRHLRRGGEPCLILLAPAPDPVLRATLRHELVHHVLEEESLAEWLNEGLAEHVAYQLSSPPWPEDVHQLLHAGLVLAGWGHPLRAVDRDGAEHELAPELWLPGLASTLRMNHREYERIVLEAPPTRDPEFHAAAHVLVRVLVERAGAAGPDRYTGLVRAGRDPLAAYLHATRLRDEDEVLDAAAASLAAAVAEAPEGEAVARSFARSLCMARKLPASWRPLQSVEAWPGGPMVSLRRGHGPRRAPAPAANAAPAL